MAAPRTIQYILTEAIYKSLQDRQFQAPIQALYQEVALRILDSLFDEWRDKIPFGQQVNFDNVEELVATQFINVSNVNYILNVKNQVPLRRVEKDEWYNIQNIINLTSQPQVYYWDELSQTIDVYPHPTNPNYSFTVWGRKALDPLQPNNLIPANVPGFMVTALIYEVAYRLCQEFGAPWDQKKEDTRQQLVKYLMAKKDVDLSAPLKTVFMNSQNRIPPFPFYYYLWGGSSVS